ncbi:MAG: amidohydrolase family protein [Daejeonella sp.]
MKKLIIIFLGLLSFCKLSFGQATVYPAKPQEKPIAIVGATIHTGTGQVIENGYITFEKGKITAIGDASVVRFNANTTDIISAAGKHIYPGFIAPMTNLGLVEIEAIRATNDDDEVGMMNPHVRSIIAYNTDSKVPNTLRSNGILLAHIVPQGGVISGESSIVELDGWNWEDAAYKTDMAVFMNWPSSELSGRFNAPPAETQRENTQKEISEIQKYFAEAKAYSEIKKPEVNNTRFTSMKGLFNGSKKLIVRTDNSKDIIAAVKYFKSIGITPIIAGATDAHLITGFLKDNQVSLIINQPHSLPNSDDQDVYLPYKQAKILSDAGINFAISINGYWQQRNLPFMAGTAAAYGLTKEQALASITLNAAKILGIDKTVGSLEVGKDATLFVSKGDALDMMSNDVDQAFIRGKTLDLDNLHKQLFKRFTQKYEGK